MKSFKGYETLKNNEMIILTECITDQYDREKPEAVLCYDLYLCHDSIVCVWDVLCVMHRVSMETVFVFQTAECLVCHCRLCMTRT